MKILVVRSCATLAVLAVWSIQATAGMGQESQSEPRAMPAVLHVAREIPRLIPVDRQIDRVQHEQLAQENIDRIERARPAVILPLTGPAVDDQPIGSGVRREVPSRSTTLQPSRSQTATPAPTRSTSPPRPRQTEPQQPLSIQLSGANGFRANQEESFQLTLVNRSSQRIAGMRVLMSPADGFRLTVLDRAATTHPTDGRVQWNIEQMDPGEEVVIRFKARANQSGRLIHDVMVDAQGDLYQHARFATTVQP